MKKLTLILLILFVATIFTSRTILANDNGKDKDQTLQNSSRKQNSIELIEKICKIKRKIKRLFVRLQYAKRDLDFPYFFDACPGSLTPNIMSKNAREKYNDIKRKLKYNLARLKKLRNQASKATNKNLTLLIENPKMLSTLKQVDKLWKNISKS
jgi:hypothetical protein